MTWQWRVAERCSALGPSVGAILCAKDSRRRSEAEGLRPDLLGQALPKGLGLIAVVAWSGLACGVLPAGRETVVQGLKEQPDFVVGEGDGVRGRCVCHAKDSKVIHEPGEALAPRR